MSGSVGQIAARTLALSTRLRVPGSGQLGQSVVELAVALPLMIMIIVATADLGRLFYAYTTLAGMAHRGAVYGATSAYTAGDSSAIEGAALAETTTLFDTSPGNPATASTTGIDPYGYQSVAVTVTYTFQPIFPYPGLPSAISMSRSVQMRVKS